MDTQVPVSSHAARQAPCKLGLRPGEHVSVETIIKALVTKSANDASAAIAEYLGGSEANFAAMMTRKAKSLGMRHTVFKNASGLPHPQQVTTARDMATLSRSIYLHFPNKYHHFRLQSLSHRGRTHRNHNHLLGKVPGLDGIKTGWVEASGFNLAASAVRMGRNNKPTRLIAVVLGGHNRHWRDRRVAELLETNFQRMGSIPGFPGKEIDNDPDVMAFLREKIDRQENAKAPSPIPLKWSSSPARVKPQKTLERDARDTLEQLAKQLKKEDWGVQLGTYASLKEARLKAQKTFSILKSGEISTPRVSKGRKSFYGARLLGLTKKEAETVCKKFSTDRKCRVLASH